MTRRSALCGLVVLTQAAFLPPASTSVAALTLPAVISSRMVLQRDMPVPIWGEATPGEEITVRFAGQSKRAKAGDDGRWMVRLDPMPVSAEPREMLIDGSLGAGTVAISDVLVGEVWLGTGQSNMALPVHGFVKGDTVLAGLASNACPLLRMTSSGVAGWVPSTPANNMRFSALLFAFGLTLQRQFGVPVGLIVGAIKGTPQGSG